MGYNPKQKMQLRYQKYKEEAALIITSLLHCSVPCMAAGIPVILAKEQCSYRMGWLEKLLPIYTQEQFSEIDWDPAPVYYEQHKQRMLSYIIERLQEAYQKYKPFYEISEFYENRKKKSYIVDAFESTRRYIDSRWTDLEYPYQYSIWGLTQISTLTVEYIQQRYKNAKLCHVYDKYRKLPFFDLVSESPENIKKYKQETIFVTTSAAKETAKKFFEEIGKSLDEVSFVEIIF